MTADDLQHEDAMLARRLHRAFKQLPDAPAALVRRAITVWPKAAPLSCWGQGVRLLLATLQFDSWALSPAAESMRAAATVARHLLFRAEGHDIELRITPVAAGTWVLSGQVLGPDDTGLVRLTAKGAAAPLHQARLSTLGEYSLPSVGAGHWVLTLVLAPNDQIIELAIEVGEPQS